METTNDAQANAVQHDYHLLHDQYQELMAECLVLNMYYQTLYAHHQGLLDLARTMQRQPPGTAAFRQTQQDYRQAQQEHRRVTQEFRRTLHQHLLRLRSYRSNQNSRLRAGLLLIRKTILIGEGNAQEAAFLKGAIQHARAHRVFLASDSTEVLCLVQNVHIDLLLLDDGLTPLAGMELYHHLHGLRGREALPAILLSPYFNSQVQAEIAHHHLHGLEKPIKVEALMRAIDQLLV